MLYTLNHLDLVREVLTQSSFGLITDVDAFRAIHAACRGLNFKSFAIGITSHEIPDNLVEETNFTLNGVDDVECFLK
ncbi:hypothetical protein ACFLV9_00860 [Chloroflexota bacterium]